MMRRTLYRRLQEPRPVVWRPVAGDKIIVPSRGGRPRGYRATVETVLDDLVRVQYRGGRGVFLWAECRPGEGKK